MSDYIKKDVLLEAIADIRPDANEYECAHDSRKITIEDVENNAYWAAPDMFDDVMSMIEGTTPADVAPVVHGYWSKEMRFTEDFMGNRTYGFKCSVCGKIANKLDFCGNCGAIMDESEEIGNESL